MHRRSLQRALTAVATLGALASSVAIGAHPADATPRARKATPTTTTVTAAPTTTTTTTAPPPTTSTSTSTSTTLPPAPPTTTTTAPPASPTEAYCSDGSVATQNATTAEGARILICTATGGWTPTAIYNLLQPNALDLSAIGPRLKVEISTARPSSTGTSASCCDVSGQYYGFAATMSLNPDSTSSFSNHPDAVMAHEYGHVWTNYWRYVNPSNAGAWTAYQNARWANADGSLRLAQSTKLNSSYNWMDYEMAADDYRRLFGTPAAQDQLTYLNSGVPDSKRVAGLAAFFLDSWR